MKMALTSREASNETHCTTSRVAKNDTSSANTGQWQAQTPRKAKNENGCITSRAAKNEMDRTGVANEQWRKH